MKAFLKIFGLIAIIAILYVVVGPSKLKLVGRMYWNQTEQTISSIDKYTSNGNSNSPLKKITKKVDNAIDKLLK